MSVNGTKRTYQLVQRTSAIEGKADIPPDLWLGRPPPCSAQPLILIFRAPNQAMEGTPLSPVRLGAPSGAVTVTSPSSSSSCPNATFSACRLELSMLSPIAVLNGPRRSRISRSQSSVVEI